MTYPTPVIQPWTTPRRAGRGALLAWAVHVDAPAAQALLGAPLFPRDELERAARFRFETPRAEFLVARGIVRSVLAQRLSMAPDAVPFGADPHRKPRVQLPGAQPDISIAHSHGWVLCALSERGAIGVDLAVDRGAPMPDLEPLARRILSPFEWPAWSALEAPARRAVFHEAWRRKEAVLKASGDGLAIDPARVEVLAAGAGGRLEGRAEVVLDGRVWRVLAVPIPEGPLAAFALESAAD